MVLHYYGSNVDQRAIIDVLRTSMDEGTLSYDIVRGGHFSILSKSVASDLFPDQAPQKGWNSLHPIGYSSFGFRTNDGCWLEDLKEAVSQDYPTIVLMHYSRDSMGGHFRVVVGYDDQAQTITVLDPWDRENLIKSKLGAVQPRVVTFSNIDFCYLWNRTEPNVNISYPPYFATMIKPWKVDLSYFENSNSNQITFEASITYPFPPVKSVPPLDTFPAFDCATRLDLPVGFTFQSNQTIDLGSLSAGETKKVTWQATPPLDDNSETQRSIDVVAYGLIKGHVPFTYRSSNSVYPPYDYVDLIGGWNYINY